MVYVICYRCGRLKSDEGHLKKAWGYSIPAERQEEDSYIVGQYRGATP